jgi:peptide/nickel transport system substrate-binding protein
MKRARLSVKPATFAIALTLITAAAFGPLLNTAVAQTSSKTLRFVAQADLRVIDPIWTTAYITRNHGYMIYDTLFALDEGFRPHPQMVASWRATDDQLSWSFTLRDGLKFHDGGPVRSADCVASLERWSKRDVLGQKLAEDVVGYTTIDDKTFTMTLKRPFPLMLAALSKISSNVPFIMPERVAKTDANTQIKETIGSGPFKFVKEEWEPGHKVVYTKNADYVPRAEPPSWAAGGKVVRVDRIEWLYIPDPATALAALMRGEVDWWENPPPDFYPTLERDPAITLVQGPLGTPAIVRFNHLLPPFDNAKIRRALLYAVNQEDYMTALAGETKYWHTCLSFYTCDTPMASEAGAEPLQAPRDLDKVKRLIKEAGYNGEKIVVLTPTDFPTLNALGLVTDALLRRLGFNVELQASDWGTLVTRRASKEPIEKGGWNIFPTTWSGVDMLDPAVNSPLRGNGANAWFGWPTNPVIEKLRDEWIDSADRNEQRKIAIAIQERAFESVPYLPVGQYAAQTAFRNSLEGVNNGPALFMWNVAKK